MYLGDIEMFYSNSTNTTSDRHGEIGAKAIIGLVIMSMCFTTCFFTLLYFFIKKLPKKISHTPKEKTVNVEKPEEYKLISDVSGYDFWLSNK